MGWFDLSSWVPGRYSQSAAPSVATTPGATATLGTAPEDPSLNSVGGRRRRHKTGRKSRRSRKTGRKSRR